MSYMSIDYFLSLLDPVLLARIQFAFTIGFHIIFPAFTIGLASFLAVLEGLWLYKKKEIYHQLYKFWIKIFAVAFGMGVVSGVVMSYQLGTNWSVFSDKISNVIGPLFGYEVLTAFFLEASFLGIMIFGWNRVSPKMHFASTCIVALGTLISAFWILSANSWMHTPQGFIIGDDGLLHPKDWFEIIFNPSFPYRFVHMVTAAYLNTAFVVGGLASYYLLKKRYRDQAKIMLKLATLMVAIMAPLQLIIGDLHGLNTLHYQPVKVSAMEGIWNTEKGAGLRVFAIIDEEKEENRYELAIPKVTSVILTHVMDGEVKGLKEWDKSDRPPVFMVFWSFRIMVGIGLIMILIGISSGIQLLRGRLFNSTFLLISWVLMSFSGFIAIIAGWCVAEIGRQPYTAYGVIRTIHSISPNILGPQVAWSLLFFVVIYTLVFGAGVYYILKLMRKGFVEKERIGTYYDVGLEHTVVQGSTKEERE